MSVAVWGAGTATDANVAVRSTRALRQRLAISVKAAIRDLSCARGTNDLLAVAEQERALLTAALEVLATRGPELITPEQRRDNAWLQQLERDLARADEPLKPARVRNRSVVPRVKVEPEPPSPEPEPAAPVPVTAYQRSRARRGLSW